MTSSESALEFRTSVTMWIVKHQIDAQYNKRAIAGYVFRRHRDSRRYRGPPRSTYIIGPLRDAGATWRMKTRYAARDRQDLRQSHEAAMSPVELVVNLWTTTWTVRVMVILSAHRCSLNEEFTANFNYLFDNWHVSPQCVLYVRHSFLRNLR